MPYDYNRKKTASVDKVPLFSQFETTVHVQQIEKMVSKHAKVKPGSVKLERRILHSHNGAYINFTYETTDDKPGAGSIISSLEYQGDSVRAYAFVNIDG